MSTETLTVLLTGAFGRLGEMTCKKLKAKGFKVIFTDLDNEANRKVAEKLGEAGNALWGDITQPEYLVEAIKQADAIIHLAAILPPVSENLPELARKVNIEATKTLVDMAMQQSKPPVFIFPSSVTVFGHQQDKAPPRKVNEDIIGTDEYTNSKVECERYIKQSGIPYVIGRVGVSIDSRTTSTDLATLKKLLATRSDNRMEYVHPNDIATALCNAVGNEAALGKILLLGGGETCQVRQLEFIRVVFGSAGINVPEDLLGNESYYYDWMDTTEAQQILDFQHTSFQDYADEMQEKMKWARLFCKPISPLIVLFLRFLTR